MARVKIKFPTEKPLFHTTIPVRISDINYGRHLGNDAVLSLLHETRMQMLSAWGWDELNCDGAGLIMADVMIAYKSEAHYGHVLHAEIFADEVEDRSFDLLYCLYREEEGRRVDVAHAKTGMIVFDYNSRKIVAAGTFLKNRLQGMVF